MIITNNFNSLADEQLVDINGGTRNLFEDIGYAAGYAVGRAAKAIKDSASNNSISSERHSYSIKY